MFPGVDFRLSNGIDALIRMVAVRQGGDTLPTTPG
jgi:hypothetical protein